MTESKPSKSARKREQHALQELGEALIALNRSELSSMPIDDRLRKAIRDARQIKSHGALRRQKQLIGKLMREIDADPVRAELAKLRADDVRQKRLFARAERWRDRMIREGTVALGEFDAQVGAPDKDLRDLLVEHGAARSEKIEKTVRRQIFRRVHEILVKISQ